MLPQSAEVLIVGGGIVGLTLARALAIRGREPIVVLEKEEDLGRHASGRNSGVLHAGIYYAPDTLKAASCLAGNRLMKAFCREKGLPLHEGGKVVVARDDSELPALTELYRRASANGAQVEWLDEQQLADVEPMARTAGKAILSRDTAAIDPGAVLAALEADLKARGVHLATGCAFLGLDGTGVAQTSQGRIGFARFINAAGAWCDRVARPFGLASDYRLIPFKGIYRKLRPGAAFEVRGNIYPVPDLRNPFLGVHFTRSTHGEVFLGPTAIPALGRESYRRLEGAAAEGLAILAQDAVLFFGNAKFRAVALREPRKYLPFFFHRDAARLVLVERHAGKIVGTLSCYDRVIVQGTLPGVGYAAGMTGYLKARGLRIFDFADFSKPLTQAIRENAQRLADEHGLKIEYIRSPKLLRKEDRIAEVLAERGDHPGLVHIFPRQNARETHPALPWRPGREEGGVPQ